MTYVLILAAVLVLLNTYPLLVSQDLMFQSKKTTLQRHVSVMASSLAGLEILTPEGVSQVMALLDDKDLARLIVTNASGLIVYDDWETGGAAGRYAFFSEIVQALDGNDVFYSEYSDGAFRSRAAVPVMYRNMAIGAVYAYEYDTVQGELLKGFQANLRNISVLIGLIVIVMSVTLSKALTRRISELLRAIRIVREGEYSHRAIMRGSDELAQLATEFNSLTGRLQATEESRRRFVSDASHELKTPLSSIRLLTDSILQTEAMDETTVREFVSDIGEEAERLTRITEKLLRLTRLDDKTETEATEVNLREVLEKAIHMLTPLAASSGVELIGNLENQGTVRATEDELYQVAFNLIENGIKYNVPGGFVRIALRNDEEGTVLLVEDSGIGIPEEDMPRIFERFYRVDKARSRMAGGTGLGLSIVKDTVERYGGTVKEEPREEGGSRFVVRFPGKGGSEA